MSTELMLAVTVVLAPFNVLKQPHPKVLLESAITRLPDILSYAVSIGLIDALSKKCMKIREPIEAHQSVVLSVLACLGLLTKFTDVCPKNSSSSKLLSVVKSTELFGTISLLYATIVPVGEKIPPRTVSVAASAFNLILTIANLDLDVFQSIMGQESLLLQYLDVVTILLKYCGPKTNENRETQAVIVDLVATLGFLCANNKQNQNRFISDQSSVILKSLSKLPKSFDIVVYPTLLCLTCDNDGAKNVIGKEFDLKLIEDYEKSDSGKKNKMLMLLHSNSKENNKSNK
ncbi:uncharacterized protein LOC116348431 [Contarinia nasturtii]|uniref:uncharacterized protein LOC116348431 n=1 Tax=Contarinia nasturtii TaxID=265458 RepID=UPI0012D486AD|nr:uncharacterized protein LOC116348431 [Contarinia nasturtii]